MLLLAAALLAGSGQVQKSLNRDRQELDLTQTVPLEKRAAAAGVYDRGAGRVPRADFQFSLDSRQ